jgi:hypothetical protein
MKDKAAFPVAYREGYATFSVPGLTMREYIAISLFQGYIAKHGFGGFTEGGAADAVRYADYLMLELEK